jgi:hypothetical protein
MSFYLGLVALLSVSMLLPLKRSNRKKGEIRLQAIHYPVALVVTACLLSLVIEKLGYIVRPVLVAHPVPLRWIKNLSVIGSILTLIITYFGFTYLGVRFPPGILTVFGL